MSIYIGEVLQADGIKLALKTLKAGLRTELMISMQGNDTTLAEKIVNELAQIYIKRNVNRNRD